MVHLHPPWPWRAAPSPLSGRPGLGWDKQLTCSPPQGSFLASSPLLAEPCPFPDPPQTEPPTLHPPQSASFALREPSPAAEPEGVLRVPRSHTHFLPAQSITIVSEEPGKVSVFPSSVPQCNLRQESASLCELQATGLHLTLLGRSQSADLLLPGWAQSQKELTFWPSGGEGLSTAQGRGSRPPSLCASPLRPVHNRPASLQTPFPHRGAALPPGPGLGISPTAPASGQSGPIGPPGGSQAVSTALCVPHTQREGPSSGSSHPVSPLPLTARLHRAPGPGRRRGLRFPSHFVPGVATSTHTAHMLCTALPGQHHPVAAAFPSTWHTAGPGQG